MKIEGFFCEFSWFFSENAQKSTPFSRSATFMKIEGFCDFSWFCQWKRSEKVPHFLRSKKDSLNTKFWGSIFLGHPGPTRRDIPDKNFMQVAFFCCFRQGFNLAGISRDLGRDVPDLEKLYARKLWADFSYPISRTPNFITPIFCLQGRPMANLCDEPVLVLLRFPSRWVLDLRIHHLSLSTPKIREVCSSKLPSFPLVLWENIGKKKRRKKKKSEEKRKEKNEKAKKNKKRENSSDPIYTNPLRTSQKNGLSRPQ